MNEYGAPITLKKFIPGSRPDVFKAPQYERNRNLFKMVQSISSELNRTMYKELKYVSGPEILYTRTAITVGEFVTTKVLSAKPREKRSSSLKKNIHNNE